MLDVLQVCAYAFSEEIPKDEYTLLSIILLYLFITIIGMRAYSYDTDSVYESQEIVVETEMN